MAGFRRVCCLLLRPIVTSEHQSFLPAAAARLIFHRGVSTRLFVKGISFSTTEDAFKEAFAKYGQLVEASIIKNKENGRSKGYGYVAFATSDDALQALDDMNGNLLDGRVVFVDMARPKRHTDFAMPIARGPPEPVQPANDELFRLRGVSLFSLGKVVNQSNGLSLWTCTS